MKKKKQNHAINFYVSNKVKREKSTKYQIKNLFKAFVIFLNFFSDCKYLRHFNVLF